MTAHERVSGVWTLLSRGARLHWLKTEMVCCSDVKCTCYDLSGQPWTELSRGLQNILVQSSERERKSLGG